MNSDIIQYNLKLDASDKEICDFLAQKLSEQLPVEESKVWHGHPVWFINGNPIAGYSKQKKGIRLMFWSGADFEEPKLNELGAKFKDASIFYHSKDEIEVSELNNWINKSKSIQWDYKNIVKRKGKLEKLTS